jgi:hypothetical protein
MTVSKKQIGGNEMEKPECYGRCDCGTEQWEGCEFDVECEEAAGKGDK